MLPILCQQRVAADAAEVRRADALAAALLREQPALAPEGWVRQLMARTLLDAPTVHLGDLAAIPLVARFQDVAYLQDRAVIRAMPGDFVAALTPHDAAFAAYCALRLGLGPVTWLHPAAPPDPLRVATACWDDPGTRSTLVTALRAGRLAYLHPYLGSGDVWALARRLTDAAQQPLRVIAPPPALTDRVNDKIWFADVVTRLFGDRAAPPTHAAWNLASATTILRRLAAHTRTLVLKVPSASGATGTLLVPSAEVRGRPLSGIRERLRDILIPFGWTGATWLLVGGWEAEAWSSPSAQLWIPPEGSGPPVVEGIFEQTLTDEIGRFRGATAAPFATPLLREIAGRTWLVARVFQRLGYVGRCSFDLILVGDRDDPLVQFVECNGRWGGTSIPMTLMNRLFGDWRRHPYATREVALPGIARLRFGDLVAGLDDLLYDARTGTGTVILYNPHHLRSAETIDVIAIGASPDTARSQLLHEVPSRLGALLRRVRTLAGAPPNSPTPNPRTRPRIARPR